MEPQEESKKLVNRFDGFTVWRILHEVYADQYDLTFVYDYNPETREVVYAFYNKAGELVNPLD